MTDTDIGVVAQGRRPFVIRRFLAPLPERTDGSVVGDRQQPGRDRGSRPVAARVPPDVDEHLVREFLGGRLVTDDPRNETKNAGLMPREESLQRDGIGAGDSHDKLIVRNKPVHGSTPSGFTGG